MALGSTTRCSITFFATTVIVYGMMSYGGIRSPDGEVMFRTAESLANHGSFAVSEMIDWKDFGLPQGVDGRRYSIFGPGQAIASVPFVKIGQLINRTKWYESVPQWVPISHYVNDGLIDVASGRAPRDLEPHALRFIVSWFNVLIGALTVVLFYLFARRLTDSNASACCVTILFAFGSLLMPYAGSCFSEPMATLLVMASLYCLVGNEIDAKNDVWSRHSFRLTCSGLFLGMAICTHITAILFTPFFFAYAVYPFFRKNRPLGKTILGSVIFLAGLGAFVVALGCYNYARFGNALETGRTADPNMAYARFVVPWQGIEELLFGASKGIVLFCPAVVMGVLTGWPFFKKFRFLSIMILATVMFRIVFIACRSDWSGGFCIGPRYLLMVVPLLMLPLTITVAKWLEEGRGRAIAIFCALSALCVAEQTSFCFGEIFLFWHAFKWSARGRFIEENWLYTSWEASPLLYLVDGVRGAYVLRFLPADIGNRALWSGGAFIVGALTFLVDWKLLSAAMLPSDDENQRQARE